ncbi:MAG: hypothetical protein ABI939_08440 [Anaerolineaceae bacterium]
MEVWNTYKAEKVRWLCFDFDIAPLVLFVLTVVAGAILWETGKLAWHPARSRVATTWT